MMITMIQSIIKQKFVYFRKFWSLIDLGIIVCSWTIVGLYIWKYQEFNHIGDLFKKTNGYTYINLQTAVYIDNLCIYLLSFCCFFATIKFVYLCRFNYRLMYFIKTLQHASKSILSFTLMFSIVYWAFMVLFYFLFISKLRQCSTIFQTAEMLFEMTLLKFDAQDIYDSASILGPISFSLFILLVVFVCLSMFLTILNESFRYVRNNFNEKSTEYYDILSFMFSKLQRLLGIYNFYLNKLDVNSLYF